MVKVEIELTEEEYQRLVERARDDRRTPENMGAVFLIKGMSPDTKFTSENGKKAAQARWDKFQENKRGFAAVEKIIANDAAASLVEDTQHAVAMRPHVESLTLSPSAPPCSPPPSPWSSPTPPSNPPTSPPIIPPTSPAIPDEEVPFAAPLATPDPLEEEPEATAEVVVKEVPPRRRGEPAPKPPRYSEAAERVWAHYPRKVGKAVACPAIDRLLRRGEATEASLIAGLDRWMACEQWQRDGGKYIPHGSTFFGPQRMWEDDPNPQPPRPTTPAPVTVDWFDRWMFGKGTEDDESWSETQVLKHAYRVGMTFDGNEVRKMFRDRGLRATFEHYRGLMLEHRRKTQEAGIG